MRRTMMLGMHKGTAALAIAARRPPLPTKESGDATCFGTRAVKVFGADSEAAASIPSSFVCDHSGTRLAVASGVTACDSMRRYSVSGDEADIDCAFSTVTCVTTPQAGERILLASTLRGNCSVTVVRPNGSISFAATGSECSTDVSYFHASAKDLVILHSGPLHPNVASVSAEACDLEVESIAEDVLGTIAARAGANASTVVVARVGSLDHLAPQPPATM